MNSQAGTVVLVHGLWFGAWSMRLLERRLRKAGFEPCRFKYSSTRAGLDEHAVALGQFVARQGHDSVYFVAHSLGGLVTLRMLTKHPEYQAARVVLLGSPLNGSVVARKSARIPGFVRLLGRVRQALDTGFALLPPGGQVGMIAGSRAVGLGQLLGGTRGAGDGTVAIRETQSDGLRDHLVLPVTHTGLLFSSKVARQVGCFLRSGNFNMSP